MPCVIVTKSATPEGALAISVSVHNGVVATEALTLLELAGQRLRRDLGLPALK